MSPLGSGRNAGQHGVAEAEPTSDTRWNMKKPDYNGRFVGQCAGTETLKVATGKSRPITFDKGTPDERTVWVKATCKNERPFWVWNGSEWLRLDDYAEQRSPTFDQKAASAMFREVMRGKRR